MCACVRACVCVCWCCLSSIVACVSAVTLGGVRLFTRSTVLAPKTPERALLILKIMSLVPPVSSRDYRHVVYCPPPTFLNNLR